MGEHLHLYNPIANPGPGQEAEQGEGEGLRVVL